MASTLSESRQWTIGGTVFHLEVPDILWVRSRGECTREDAVRIVNLYRELAAEHAYFVLSDLRDSKGMDPEARRYMSENLRSEWFLGMILFNTRLLHRAIARGLVLAAALTRSPEDPPRARVHVVSTREQALELLEQWRAEVAASRG